MAETTPHKQEVQVVQIPVHHSTEQFQVLPPPTHKERKWWVLVVFCVALLIVGQFCGRILQNIFINEGGRGTWMIALIQTAGFPILILPYLLLFLCLIYLFLGTLLAASTMLYSVGILYISVSRFAGISATQLFYTLTFSYLINHHKVSNFISLSAVLITLSAVFSTINGYSFPGKPSTGSPIPAIGHPLTQIASIAFCLMLSLMRLSFDKVILKRTNKTRVRAVLEMQIFTAMVASIILVIGLLATSERTSTLSFVSGFNKGTKGYVLILVGAGLGWQAFSVGAVGLVLLVSPFFSNVVNVFVMPFLPVVAALFFDGSMSVWKIIAMPLALVGFGFYLYQLYRFEDGETGEEGSEQNEGEA
ncbi:LOW QUALITY PROTEIN: probable purine permease 11 [Carica papaya]|uniref:LOW QUALITY PROTEIN: probable purine permease 11 n=1 Tax=Carica papaya TaxID=3649 RepID=UPI000B8C9C3E|nr:LOW QUALITY PROTEIN: probable purine permease 11 [Carica papaya]